MGYMFEPTPATASKTPAPRPPNEELVIDSQRSAKLKPNQASQPSRPQDPKTKTYTIHDAIRCTSKPITLPRLRDQKLAPKPLPLIKQPRLVLP